MSEYTFDDLGAFMTAFEPLCASFGNALCENFGQMIELEAPSLSLQTMDALMADASAVLYTTFSYPAVSIDEGVLIFRETEAAALGELLLGNDGSNPPQVLEDSAVDSLSAALEGTVRGLGIALGNHLNKTVEPSLCETAFKAVTLPPAFAVAGQVVQCIFTFTIADILTGEFRLLFTPDFATAIAGDSPAAPAAPQKAAEDTNVVGQEDIEQLLAGMEGAQASPGGGAAFGAMPMAVPGGAFQPFEVLGGAPESLPRGMELILDIPLEVSVELGRVRMLIKDVLELSAGSIVELDRIAGEPVDVLVNGRLVAKGEVVVIEDNFGIRITEIVSPADRLNSVAKRAS
jgi:flagellar motor switch protein FliN/FliY